MSPWGCFTSAWPMSLCKELQVHEPSGPSLKTVITYGERKIDTNESANLRQVDCLVFLELKDLLKLTLLLEEKLSQDVVCGGLEIIVHVKGLQLRVETRRRAVSAKVRPQRPHSHQGIFTMATAWLCNTAAATLKSLRSCPTLHNPTDGSPPGSPVPGILQARTLEWAAISFSSAW